MSSAVFIVLSLSLFLDLFLRSHGIAAVFTPFCIFYYTAVLNWKTGLAMALITAVPAAVFAGCVWPSELITYPAVAGLSLWNQHKSGPSEPTFRWHLLCGALIPLLVFGPKALTSSSDTLFAFLIWLLPLCTFSAVLLPCTLFLLDFFAEKLGLTRYADAARKREHPPL